MVIGGKVMKMIMKSFMGVGKEMRKGMSKIISARAGEKMKNFQDTVIM